MLTEKFVATRHLLLRGLAIAAALVLLACQSGCGTLYVTQAAVGQWRVMHAREPIAAVIAKPDTPEALRATLTQVEDARGLAARDLGLPDNGSYRTYADIHRNYVVWNVVATPEFAVAPLRWCFPVAGCVFYRGYFHEARARRFAVRLARNGNDVTLNGVTAYSTLGTFADPVLSTMIGYGDVELVATIFHELAHQLIYVKGDSEFNEAFAVAVEQVGIERWLAARGRTRELKRHVDRELRQAEVARLFAGARTQLAALYAVAPRSTAAEREALRAQKQEILAALGREIRVAQTRNGIARSGYDDWIDAGLNNAHLASVAGYYDCVPGFRRLLEDADGALPRFYDAVRAAARLPRARRHQLLCTSLTQRDEQ